MVSYFKTQWVNLLAGLVNFGISIYNYCTGNELWGISWTIAAVVWFLMSFINYNEERIKVLEKKAEKYDALCELVEALRVANEVDRDFADHLNRKIDSFILEAEKARVKTLEKYNTHEEIE